MVFLITFCLLSLENLKTAFSSSPISTTIGITYSVTPTTMKRGIVTAISPDTGISASHIFRDFILAEIDIAGKTRKILKVEPIRKSEDNSSLGILYKDACYVTWSPPIEPQWEAQYASQGLRSPSVDEAIWIPRLEEETIVWEKRYITGKENFSAWTGLPKPLYQIVLFLNNKPISFGNQLKLGDSGGGWLSQSGELLAVTSRIASGDNSPNTQTIYGTTIAPECSPKDTGQSNYPATIPLLGSALVLIIIKNLASKGKINYGS